MKYSPKDEQINAQFYGYFLRHNEDDGWGDKDKYGNFKLLSDITNSTDLPFSQASVLDVGCGTGDFAPYLRELDVKEYLGIDIYQLSVELAAMKCPKEHFVTGDFLTYPFTKKFNYVFFSGALAAILETDNYEMLRAFITKMWSLAQTGVAFNFLTREYAKQKDNELFLYDLEEVLRICKDIAPKALLTYVQNHAGDDLDFLQTHVYLLRR